MRDRSFAFPCGSGIRAIPRTPVRRPLPSLTESSNAPRPSKSYRIGSGGILIYSFYRIRKSIMPVTSALLDQAHNAIDRKFFMMKAFHHSKGNHQAFLSGLAYLYNLVPTSVGPCVLADVAWKCKAGDYRKQTDSSLCKSSPLEACDEW